MENTGLYWPVTEVWQELQHSRKCAISASWRTLMPVKPPPRSAFSITPAGPTRSAKCMKARPSWTGWSRSRSAASPSPPPRPPASGRIAPSILSTRRATWISRPKWSAACACWTERWRCSTRWRAFSRNRKQCGARPISTAFRAFASSTKWTASARTSIAPSEPLSTA